MKTRRTIVAWLAALACAGSLGLAHESEAPVPCPSGAGLGAWDLPVASGGNGYVDGTLLDRTTPGAGFAFAGVLTDIPVACPSCILGRVEGLLDDGTASYEVFGMYYGSSLDGTGLFRAHVVLPGTSVAVGRIVGSFDDHPAQDGPGTFRSRWGVCD